MSDPYLMALIAITTAVNLFTVLFNLKLYTEIMKEKSQRERKP